MSIVCAPAAPPCCATPHSLHIVGHVLDNEAEDLQAHLRYVRRGLITNRAGKLLAVLVDLLDGERAWGHGRRTRHGRGLASTSGCVTKADRGMKPPPYIHKHTTHKRRHIQTHCICTHSHTHTSLYTYIVAYVYTNMHAITYHMHTQPSTRTHQCRHTQIHAHTNAGTRGYTHTPMQAHTDTCTTHACVHAHAH